jgi:hypothetical protein
VTTVHITLKQLVEAMARLRDDEPFRWFQKSHVGVAGWAEPDETLVVTMGQARKELGIS